MPTSGDEWLAMQILMPALTKQIVINKLGFTYEQRLRDSSGVFNPKTYVTWGLMEISIKCDIMLESLKNP